MTDPSREISIDMFGPPGEPEIETAPEPVAEPVRITAESPAAQRAREEHEQMVLTSEEAAKTPRPRNVTPAPMPVAIIYPSRTDGPAPHIVTLALWKCTCEAAVLGNRDCWAIAEAKRLFGDAR